MAESPAFLTLAHQLADAAGAAIRPYFGAHGDVDTKTDDSPVTIADRAAEQAMRALIAERFPEHGIYGEEFGETRSVAPSPLRLRARKNDVLTSFFLVEGSGSLVRASRHAPLPSPPRKGEGTTEQASNPHPISPYTWILDPIDGTRAFIAGKKEWGTLIALCENGVPILGILDQPITGERWVGVRGEGMVYYKNRESPSPENREERFSTSPKGEVEIPPRDLSMGNSVGMGISGEGIRLSTTSRRYFTPDQALAYEALAAQCGEVIEDGDCYAYGLLARGERDLVVDAGLKPYDILALVPIIEGAGGVITAWDGSAITLTNAGTAVAGRTRELHGMARPLLTCWAS